MAENTKDILEQPKSTVEKEARLRTLKERQNEERHRKLEEIKAQAFAAQRFKEQKEQERRRRLEEMRLKDDSRRHQVEERKRAINEAERDRLESILRRNQEREARIESKKKNERSSIVFAFGSSTPRMLDPTDMSVSFWGHRRATSTQNITTTASNSSNLTRRQSERELDVGSKKRATSAGGLERSAEGLISPTTPAGCVSGYLGRRRTDLVPTIPSRDSSFHSSASRKSLNHSPASSRPSSSMSQQSTNSVTSSVNMRHRVTAPRRPRPVSIAVTGVTQEVHKSFDKGDHKPPIPKTRKPLSKTNTSEKIEKPMPRSKAVKSPAEETAPKIVGEDKKQVKEDKKVKEVKKNEVKKTEVQNVKSEEVVQVKDLLPPPVVEISGSPVLEDKQEETHLSQEPQVIETSPEHQPPLQQQNIIQKFIDTERSASFDETSSISTVVQESTAILETKLNGTESNDIMTASMSKPRITTEEEAKAALAERRRLIREEAERQAELERQKIEAEQKAELERQQKEEEQARILAHIQRQAEQERLQEAIREAQKREEEEQLRKEEEQKQKVLKEEADKKAKEEAEKQKAELQKKLENEEREREERRKRVEMIMSRTRGKSNANVASQQNSQDKNENASEPKQVDENTINEENQANENKLNGTKQENGTTENSAKKNGKRVDVEIVDNIIPDESVKNANTVAVTDTINADSINSNSSWQASSQQSLGVS